MSLSLRFLRPRNERVHVKGVNQAVSCCKVRWLLEVRQKKLYHQEKQKALAISKKPSFAGQAGQVLQD